MVVRVVVVVLMCSSLVFGQRERFKEEDLGRYAMISKIATDFEEFGLSSDQLDALKINEARLGDKLYSFNGEETPVAEYLDKIYEVLDDKQEARLHEIMFQRWMNRDDLVTAINTFAPGEVQDLEKKAEPLQKEIAERLKDTISKLPEEQREHAEPLREFLRWRWGKQTKWLTSELGDERSKELIGKPIALGYQFVTKGDPIADGIRAPFGDSYGGGRWFGTSFGSSGRSNNVYTSTVGLDPSTGKAPKMRVRRRDQQLQRPVDVPDGMTLAKAVAKLEAIEQGMRDTYEEAVPGIQELRDFRNPANRANPGNRRAMMVEARKAEASLEEELAVMNVTKEKLRAMIVKLGGDPDAKSKEIQAARDVFMPMRLSCNSQPFVNYVDATAAQCDEFDKIMDKFTDANGSISERQKEEYYAEVMKVLDKRQQALLRQQLFRSYWFSKDCKKAFSLTEVKLTEEQKVEVAKLARSLTATQRAIQADRMNRSRGFGRVHLRRFDFDRDDRTLNDEPYLLLKQHFTDALAGIVGAEDAAKLIGKPMEYDRDWKRPVVVPEGLTLETAKQQYQKLATEKKQRDEKNRKMMDKMMEAGGFGGLPFLQPNRNDALKWRQLDRQVRIAKRIVEELDGSTEDH